MQNFLEETIIEAGTLAKKYFEVGVSHTIKSNPQDLLTEADVAVNDFIIKKIREQYPDHAIHSEENEHDINSGSEYEWVIDPIDGTWNFAMRVPVWSILISLSRNGETLHGAAYSPLSKELFCATKGNGATCNGVPIHVGNNKTLKDTIGFVHVGPENEFCEKFAKASYKASTSGARIRNYLAGHVKCYVASGKLDFYFANRGETHDYLVPKLICEEAGAVVTDSDGNPWNRGRQDIVIANPLLHKEIMKFFS